MKSVTNMKKIIAVLCAAVGLLAAVLSAGCGGQDGPNKKVAVAFANSSSSWQKNGNTMKELLEKEALLWICSLRIRRSSRWSR